MPLTAQGQTASVGIVSTVCLTVTARAVAPETDPRDEWMGRINGKNLFLRGHEHLYCIAEK